MLKNNTLQNPYNRENPFKKSNRMYGSISKYDETSLQLNTLKYKYHQDESSMFSIGSSRTNQYLPDRNINKITQFEKMLKTTDFHYKNQNNNWKRPNNYEINKATGDNPFYRKNLLNYSYDEPKIYQWARYVNYNEKNNWVQEKPTIIKEKRTQSNQKQQSNQKIYKYRNSDEITSPKFGLKKANTDKKQTGQNPEMREQAQQQQKSDVSFKIPNTICVRGKKYFNKKVEKVE